MANPWCRLYAEFQSDPKVQMMSEAMQRRLVMLFCARCSEMLHDDELALAFLLRITKSELAETKSLFLAKGFIDENWNLVNWNKRQSSPPDSSAERTRRWRERKRTSQEWDGDDDVTPQERHGDGHGDGGDVSRREENRTEKNRKEQKKPSAKRGGKTKAAVSNASHSHPVAKANGEQKSVPDECELIYEVYPKHKDKKAALVEIAKVLKKIPYAELLAKVERFAQKVKTENMDMQFVKYPAKWFKAGSYEDDDLKPPVEYDVVVNSPEEWLKGESHGTKN